MPAAASFRTTGQSSRATFFASRRVPAVVGSPFTS